MAIVQALESFLDCLICRVFENRADGRADDSYATGALEEIWSERTGETYNWDSEELLRCPRCGTVYDHRCSFEWDNSPTPPIDDSTFDRLVPSRAEKLLAAHAANTLSAYAAYVDFQLDHMTRALARAALAEASDKQVAYVVSFTIDRWVTAGRWDLLRGLFGHSDARVQRCAVDDLRYLQRISTYFTQSIADAVKRHESEWSAAFTPVAAALDAADQAERERWAREYAASQPPPQKPRTVDELLDDLAKARKPSKQEAIVHLLYEAHEQGADISAVMPFLMLLDEARRAKGKLPSMYDKLQVRIRNLVHHWVQHGRDPAVVERYLLARIDNCPRTVVEKLPYQQSLAEKKRDEHRLEAVQAVNLLTTAWVNAGHYDQFRSHLLQHDYDHIRGWAITDLRDLDVKRVAPLLADVKNALLDSSEYVRTQAHHALAQFERES